MEQKTISINYEHNRSDMMKIAWDALKGLDAKKVTYLPIEAPPDRVDYELIKDDQGHRFRYTRQFDMTSGVVQGRIDIRYEKPGASR